MNRKRIEALLIEHGYSIKTAQDNIGENQRQAPKSGGKIQFVKYAKDGYFVEHNGDYITKMIDGAEQTAKNHGYSLGIVNVVDDDIMPTFEAFNGDATVSGIIFLGTEFDAENESILRTLKCPIVVVDTRMGNYPFNCVSIDERDGVYHAIRHLYDLGHRSITYLRSSIKNDETVDRELGFELAITKLGLDRKNIHYIDMLPNANDSFKVMSAELAVRKPATTAYFASNDMIAIGAIRAFKTSGYAIPNDVSIIGFDDLNISSAIDPPLTSMSIGKYVIGQLAVERLIDLIHGNNTFCVKTHVSANLVVRNTTGRYKS